jgi:hypothetical protein
MDIFCFHKPFSFTKGKQAGAELCQAQFKLGLAEIEVLL